MKKQRAIHLSAVLFVIMTLLAGAVTASGASQRTEYLVKSMISDDGSEEYKYAYNSDGLLIKTTYVSGDTVKYYYKNRRLVRSVEKSDLFGENFTTSYSYDKKGRTVKLQTVDNNTKKTVIKETYTYDKKGRVTKAVSAEPGKKTVSTLSYNSSGLVTSVSTVVTTGKKESKYSMKFKYNKKKNISWMRIGKTAFDRTYKYDKHGCVRTRTDKQDGAKAVYTYKYVKVKVPTACRALRQKQQMDIIENRWEWPLVY